MFTTDLHIHTIASTHAYSTVNEYVGRAKSIGLKLIAITDHGPALHDSPSPWHFRNLRVLPRVMDGVAILRGIEANILDNRLYPEHPLDCEDAILSALDIVLAGFHYPSMMPQDEATHTRLIVETIQSGRVHILSHPGNPQYPVNAQAVAKAATAYNVALEVNNSSFLHVRKGSEASCRELILAQKAAGGYISMGSDAHHTHSLGVFDEACSLVKELDFPQERIISRSPETVLEFLALHGKTISDQS